MPDLMPRDIVAEVREVLSNAHRGKGSRPNFLSAYQILDRLPSAVRERLVNERTHGGRDVGTSFAAPSVISKAARLIPGIEVEYMDSVGMSFQIAGQPVVPSNEVCGLYRLSFVDEEID